MLNLLSNVSSIESRLIEDVRMVAVKITAGEVKKQGMYIQD